VVDDEPRGVELLARCLRPLGTIHSAASAEAGWAIAQSHELDLVVSDQRMPGMSGVELLTRIAEQQPHTGRILITGYTDLGSTIDAINRGRVHAYLAKPCSPDDLRLTARSVLEKLQLARDNDRLVADLSEKNEALERALESLAEAQQRVIASERLAAIGRMIAMIVHDLRGPLTVIRSASSELLREDATDPQEHEELVRDVLEQVERMQRMCEELLDVTRASQGAIQRVEEDLDEVVGAALAHVVEDASHLGVEVVQELASGVRLPVDEDRLRRALLNLCFNALEAMPEGGTLRVVTTRSEGSVTISVVDSGSGIPSEIRDSVFDPFVTSGKPRGTGLGLAIVKKVVEDHGGHVELGKPEGGGTAFHLHLSLTTE
jgi:signal transduction histidine kinase